jgi:hypothetical protein
VRQTKLILFEGLPSTGKSTNSGFLLDQLEKSGLRSTWIHEMARPHPTLFFSEASLDEREYLDYILRFPQTASALEKLAFKYGNYYGIDLLEIEWNHDDIFSEEAILHLKEYDVWNFSIDRYKLVALEKWRTFVEKQMKLNEIVILDSSIFQFQIYSFLLANRTYEELAGFIEKLFDIIEPLNPKLIYFYRENTNDTIEYLIQERGLRFLENIWERDRNQPYYKERVSGSEGYKMFLVDYGQYANRLFTNTSTQKLALEISGGSWSKYEHTLLQFFDLPYVKSDHKYGNYPSGKYHNEILNQMIEISGDYLITPNGGRKRIVPKSKNVFSLSDIPVRIQMYEESLVLTGGQICEQWTSKGTVFKKIV